MDYGTLRVTTPDGQIREYPIDVPVAFVGRAEGNRVVIDHVTVSRRHARLAIDSGRLMVEDLGSATGTFVGTQRIAPHSPNLVEEGESLRFGDVEAVFLAPAPESFQLVGLPTDMEPGPAPIAAGPVPGVSETPPPTAPERERITPPPPPPTPPPPTAGPGQGAAQPINVSVKSPTASVAAGSPTTATVVLQNRGTTVDEFSLSVPDLPAEWVRISRPTIPLLPGARDEVTIVIHPPRTPESRAGEHPFAIAVVSRDLGIEVRALGKITIQQFDGFQMALRPVRATRDFKVVAENTGNAPTTYSLTGTDDESSLNYRLETEALELQPGEERAIGLRVRPGDRRWFGREEIKPFRIEAKPAAAGAQKHTVDGQLRSRATLEAWKWLIVAALLGGVLAGGAWGYTRTCSSSWPLCGGGTTSPNQPATQQPTGQAATPTIRVLGTATRPPETPTPPSPTATPPATAAKFKPGDLVLVTGTGSCLYVRVAAGLSNTPIVCLPDAEQLTILGGPETKDDLKWWKVQTQSGEGWAAEDYLAKKP